MLQVDVSLVLESSRLDLGSHCTLCKSAQHHHLWTKRPFAPTSSSTVLVFFVEKSFFKFSRANWLKWQGMWAASSIVHYSSLLKSTLSSIGFPNDATKMSGKTYSIFVRQSHKRDWGSGKEGMDLYLVFAAAAASLCLSSLSSPPCFEAIVEPWGSTICALNWPTKSENISLVSEFWKVGLFAHLSSS